MRTCRILVVIIVVSLSGCATFKNTPQQDYVFALGKKCETPNGRFSVIWVSEDGKRWRSNVTDMGYEAQAFSQCMREQRAATPYERWLEQRGPTGSDK